MSEEPSGHNENLLERIADLALYCLLSIVEFYLMLYLYISGVWLHFIGILVLLVVFGRYAERVFPRTPGEQDDNLIRWQAIVATAIVYVLFVVSVAAWKRSRSMKKKVRVSKPDG